MCTQGAWKSWPDLDDIASDYPSEYSLSMKYDSKVLLCVLGMIAYLVVIWSAELSPLISDQDSFSLGGFVGNRWKTYTNIIWALGGDEQCCAGETKYELMMEGIRGAGAQQVCNQATCSQCAWLLPCIAT